MSYERVKHETRLTVLETEVVGERLRVEKLRDALRDLLDPTLPVEELPRQPIFALAVDFSTAHINLTQKLAQITKIKEILGRE